MFVARARRNMPSSVPLNGIAAMIDTADIAISVDDDTLIARHENFSSRIEVVAPEDEPPAPSDWGSVVRVATTLPTELQDVFYLPEFVQAANAFACLGALRVTNDGPLLESRLSIPSGDRGMWRELHLPLLAHSLTVSGNCLLGRIRRGLDDNIPAADSSCWTGNDFAMMERHLSRVAVCSASDDRLTAEFGLAAGSFGRPAANEETALFTASSTEPHHELGGGLLCTLQLRRSVESKVRLGRICNQLNALEMAALDLPPHFGAWSSARSDKNPVYVSFFPNAMHSISGIGIKAAVWALTRARWASGVIASLDDTARPGEIGPAANSAALTRS